MATESIFEGTSCRCKRHLSTLIGPKEIECDECKTMTLHLNLTPPFPVRCIKETNEGTKKDEIYTVLVTVRDVTTAKQDRVRGYLLKSNEGGVCLHVFNPENFIPEQFYKPEVQRKPLTEEELVVVGGSK